MKIFLQILKYFILVLIGGITYCCIEIINRGYTHWTMAIIGGLCFIILGLLNKILPWRLSITTQMLIGCIVITIMESCSGCLLNLWLGLNIWDYTKEQYNFLGQISLKHCVYWFFLSCAGIILDDYLRYWIFKEEKPRYHL